MSTAMKDIVQRIKEASGRVGGLNQLAELTGIPRRTLGDYIASKSEPKISTVLEIARVTNINISWLMTGEGKIDGDSDQVNQPQTLQPQLMKKLAHLVARVHKNADIKLLPEDVTAEATELYNELCTRVQNLSDMEEIESVFPQLELHLKRRLADAVAEPGSGKEKAS